MFCAAFLRLTRTSSSKQRCAALWYPMYLAGVALATVGDRGRSILQPNTWKQLRWPSGMEHLSLEL